MNEETVCAVVVTYNRKELLIICLEALENQTKPLNAIYILDNDSTDETPRLLKEKNYINELPPTELENPWEKSFKKNGLLIHYVRMHENTGGAGGFHEGVKRAYKKGYEWLWLMDDDGFPDKNCLNILAYHKKVCYFIAPLVINKTDRRTLSFNYRVSENILIKTIEEAKKYSRNNILLNIANPFNGVLICKVLLDKIGLPKKEFFIWGDETEFFLRTKKNGFKIITVTNAKFFHPKDKMEFKPVLKGYLDKKLVTGDLRSYCFYRNNFYIIKEYYGFRSLITWIGIVLIQNFITLDFHSLKIILNAWKDSILKVWGNEKYYL